MQFLGYALSAFGPNYITWIFLERMFRRKNIPSTGTKLKYFLNSPATKKNATYLLYLFNRSLPICSFASYMNTFSIFIHLSKKMI